MPTKAPTCSTCCYWIFRERISDRRLGNCRRNPPFYEGWPMTEALDWCGKFNADRPSLAKRDFEV